MRRISNLWLEFECRNPAYLQRLSLVGQPARRARCRHRSRPTVKCTVNPATSRTFKVGDFILLFNDEAADAVNAGRRSYECAQIVSPGNVGDVVPTGSFQF